MCGKNAVFMNICEKSAVFTKNALLW